MAWEPAWSGQGEAEANLVAGRLRSEGLRTRLSMSRGPSFPMMPVEAWVILVPPRQLKRARAVLREFGEGGQLAEFMDGDELVESNARTLVTVVKWSLPVVLVFALGVLVSKI